MEGLALPTPTLLSIGDLSRRTGLSVSAIRFYEARGLVAAIRTGGNQRRFMRSDIRRLSFALIAQRLGLHAGDLLTLISPVSKTTVFGNAPRLRGYKIAAIFDVGMFEYDIHVMFGEEYADRLLPGDARRLPIFLMVRILFITVFPGSEQEP